MNRALVISDNLPDLRAMPDDCVDLVYPPFNSGADYLNPIGLPAAEARGLRRDLSLPVPGANEPCEPSAWPASAPSGALPRECFFVRVFRPLRPSCRRKQESPRPFIVIPA